MSPPLADKSDAEKALREAFQHVDDLAKLFGLPYRPAWAQPFYDVWQDHCRLRRENGHLCQTVDRLKKELEEARRV